MSDLSNSSWLVLISNIGKEEVNKELDKRSKAVFDNLCDLTSLCSSDDSLFARILSMRDNWLPVRDQYERNVLHMAAFKGNTRLVRCLVYSGAPLSERDGIGQTPLTLSLHKGHANTAKFLIEIGASVDDDFFRTTISPPEIVRVRGDIVLEQLINKRIDEDSSIIERVSTFSTREQEASDEMEDHTTQGVNFARALNINVGDQKNTVTIQACANRCPDVYSCHTPGGGDFHNRGYINESIARIAGQGGFWHVTEHVMKRPTVNPASFKLKFKDNNYNNNEEALLDYDDGLSIAMLKAFQESSHFPTSQELNECFDKNASHNEVLLRKLDIWLKEQSLSDKEFQYQSQIVNDMMPITRWYKESVRHGNGMAVEGVWMLCPALFTQVGKTNYRDEAFTQIVNSLAKWPLAYRQMYQRNRAVSLDGQKGRQLAGDEWVEDFLVRPIKQFASAQSSFQMVEMMSCSANLLEMNKSMYKSREAFNVHNSKKHQKPSSIYDQLKVAKFAIREEWFASKGQESINKYPWGETRVKQGDKIAEKYANALAKGDKKAEKEFQSFLQRKFPNDMK